jgi:hypothetical protein
MHVAGRLLDREALARPDHRDDAAHFDVKADG